MGSIVDIKRAFSADRGKVARALGKLHGFWCSRANASPVRRRRARIHCEDGPSPSALEGVEQRLPVKSGFVRPGRVRFYGVAAPRTRPLCGLKQRGPTAAPRNQALPKRRVTGLGGVVLGARCSGRTFRCPGRSTSRSPIPARIRASPILCRQ